LSFFGFCRILHKLARALKEWLSLQALGNGVNLPSLKHFCIENALSIAYNITKNLHEELLKP